MAKISKNKRGSSLDKDAAAAPARASVQNSQTEISIPGNDTVPTPAPVKNRRGRPARKSAEISQSVIQPAEISAPDSAPDIPTDIQPAEKPKSRPGRPAGRSLKENIPAPEAGSRKGRRKTAGISEISNENAPISASEVIAEVHESIPEAVPENNKPAPTTPAFIRNEPQEPPAPPQPRLRKVITPDLKVIVQAEPDPEPEIRADSANLDNADSDPSELEDAANPNGGEEKLSRRARRLKEWRERKKMRRMQGAAGSNAENNDNPAEETELQSSVDSMPPPGEILQQVDAQSNAQPIIDEEQMGGGENDDKGGRLSRWQKRKLRQQDKKTPQRPIEASAQNIEVSVQPIADPTEPAEEMPAANTTPTRSTELSPLDKIGEDFPPPPPLRMGSFKSQKYNADPIQPELESIISRTLQFLEREIRIHKPATILCGVSGGADSIVLLDILAVISQRGWANIHIAHCNHSLRGEQSVQDEHFVRSLATRYGMHFHHTTVDVQAYARQYGLGIEKAARVLRYRFFDKAARACHADYIATAHNAEDNAETLMMNLMRGSGITGLAGIPPRRDLDKKLSLIRPLLWLSRQDIEHYARVRGLEWRQDESNSSLVFTRNKIRHELLPKLRADYSPGLTEVLNRTTTLMREAQEFIAEKISSIMQNAVKDTGKKSFSIQIGMFITLKDFAKGELIQTALRKYLNMQPIPMASIDRIIQLLPSPTGSQCDITKELIVVREREELVFAKREPHRDIFLPVTKKGEYTLGEYTLALAPAKPETVEYGADPYIEYFDSDLIPHQLILRTWRDGDRIQPLGMEGSMTVSDFLANEKVPVLEKKKILVLCAGNEVIWITGHRISDKFRVTEETRQILRVQLIVDTTQQEKKKPEEKHDKGDRKDQIHPQQRHRSPENNRENPRRNDFPRAQNRPRNPEEKKDFHGQNRGKSQFPKENAKKNQRRSPIPRDR